MSHIKTATVNYLSTSFLTSPQFPLCKVHCTKALRYVHINIKVATTLFSVSTPLSGWSRTKMFRRERKQHLGTLLIFLSFWFLVWHFCQDRWFSFGKTKLPFWKYVLLFYIYLVVQIFCFLKMGQQHFCQWLKFNKKPSIDAMPSDIFLTRLTVMISRRLFCFVNVE